LQGAGGVGGLLLAEEVSGGNTTARHYHYDGNGNVTEITELAGAKVASYRYDAYGNTLAATGPYSAQNRYRFSTKPLDSEVTGAPLYYYGYRYYDPITGSWPSRDSIGERGGVNLYAIVRNNSVNRIDRLGLDVWVENTTAVHGLHRRVCIDHWDGPFNSKPSDGETCCVDGKWYKKNGKYCVSFGVNTGGGAGSGSSEDGGSSDNDSSSDGSSTSADEQAGNLIPPSPFPPGFDGPDSNGDGSIYEDNLNEATAEPYRSATGCCQEDLAIEAYLKGLNGQSANYALCGQNCRDFSKAAYDYAKDNFRDKCK
jgi:RHS repeat-associated protein